MLQHKRVSLAVTVLVVAFGAALVPAVLTSGSWKVRDSSSCSTWSSANQAQQTAYTRMFVKEHGPLPNGARSPAGIEAAINSGCTAAFAYDEADTVNVTQAINGRY
jgi:hypothetical protein